jgi:hypothetical protein
MENSTKALADIGTKFPKLMNNVVEVLCGTVLGNIDETNALPTMGAS